MSQALPTVHRYTIDGCQFEARPLAPGLYLIATPIGNLRDVTIRALETLAAADLICCEDTRVTSKLLTRYSIAKPLKPYHDHNAAKVRPGLIQLLRNGASIALVSDAGTPLVSDPGYRLVVEAIDQAVHIEAIPGPSAPIVAAAVSGIPIDRFLFAGFLPSKSRERQRMLEELRHVPSALIAFDSAGRIAESIKDIEAVLGNRRIALARELTKLHEEVIRGRVRDVTESLAARQGLKGEITIVIAPPEATKTVSAEDLEQALQEALEKTSPAKAAALVARQYGASRKELYALAIRRKEMRRRDEGDE
jgi:16S rRNA (cytidine1402-2'-O)-methyltransferase